MAHPHRLRPGGERGMALVIALLALLVISMLATVLMVSVNVDTKLTGHGLLQSKALNNAEAGIGEVQGRLASGDIDLDMNPRAVAQIFNVEAGSVPVLGTDSAGFATAQPAGQWLAYSTAARGPNVLTVEYKTDPGKTVVYRYDSSKNPAVQTMSGSPIYVITSTGTAGRDRRRVRAEIYPRPVNVNVPGAVTVDVKVKTIGDFNVCGYDHSADTPTGTEADVCDGYHTGPTDKTGIWSNGTITNGGSSELDGDPTILESQTTGPGTGPNGFFAGPWEVFGLTQAQFFSWVGAPISSVPNPANGIYYIDGSASVSGSGYGFMYVDGDLSINSNFTYTGIIYVKGDVKKVNGKAWILGALIAEGQVDVTLNGTADILYSSDAISQAISTAEGAFQRLSWREIP